MNFPSLSLTWIMTRNRQAARLLMLLAVFWFGWRMAGLMWLATGQDHADLLPLQSSHQAVAAVPSDVDTAGLASFAIFRAATVAATTTTNAPDTSLQLRLDGVFAGSDTQHSSAIISEPQGGGKLYGIGQQVPGGATLQSVYADRVILQRNGAPEVLRFVKTNLLGGTPATTAPAAGGKTVQARSMLDDAINRLGQNPAAYLNEMGLTARNDGYEITANAPADIRRSLGLKPGDKVLRLNGQPLGNPQLDRQLLQQVQQTGHVRVDVQRGSQTLTLEQNF